MNNINSNQNLKDLLPVLSDILPFEDKNVWLWKLCCIPLPDENGYQLKVELEVNSVDFWIETTTENLVYASDWFFENTGDWNMETLKMALVEVVEKNKDYLIELTKEL